MTDLIIQMEFNFFRGISDLFFNKNIGMSRGGGLITLISVVLGISIFVYILRRLKHLGG